MKTVVGRAQEKIGRIAERVGGMINAGFRDAKTSKTLGGALGSMAGGSPAAGRIFVH